MKNGEIEFGYMGSRASNNQEELMRGISHQDLLFRNYEEETFDSLTYSWSMQIDTVSEPFTTEPIQPILKGKEDAGAD